MRAATGQRLKRMFCKGKLGRRGNALFVHSRRIPGVSDFPLIPLIWLSTGGEDFVLGLNYPLTQSVLPLYCLYILWLLVLVLIRLIANCCFSAIWRAL